MVGIFAGQECGGYNMGQFVHERNVKGMMVRIRTRVTFASICRKEFSEDKTVSSMFRLKYLSTLNCKKKTSLNLPLPLCPLYTDHENRGY